jgi:hypothetical protein
MPFLPKTVAALVAGDSTLARVGSNVRQAVQPTLDFLQTYFQAGADGSLRVLRNLVVQAPVTLNNGLSVRGFGIVYGTKNNTFVVVPFDNTAAFYVTNPANTAAQFLVNGDGSVFGTGTWSAQSMVSAQGFKATVSLGSYWSTNTTSGDNFNTVITIWNARTGAISLINRRWYPARAGSIVGITANHNNTIAGATGWGLYKNGVGIASCNVPANGTYGTANFAKGALPFNAGDLITSLVSVGAGYNFAGQLDIDVEYGA